MYEVSACKEGREIHISSPTGQNIAQNGVARFHAVWLRDNAWDGETRAVGNGQRLIALRDIPANTTVTRAEVDGDILTLTFAPEGKKVDYDINWLLKHAYDRGGQTERGWTAPQIETWDSGLKNAAPVADFEAVQNDDGALQEWLAAIARYGFGRLDNGPVADQALMGVVGL
ncbi:MAG: 2-trimethylaminoethylphosphonate dioxygenase, partial [Alphaproteobacteria bacterium]